MKKIRTASGGILFLEDDDYMPKLLAYLRETAGNDAADLVEEWAREEKDKHADALAEVELARLTLSNRVLNLEAMLRDERAELSDEREEHLEEISELEEELTRVAGLKDEAVAFNRALSDLVTNPEKLFPEIGTEVYRDTKDGKHDVGRILAYKLRMDARTGRPEFFVKVTWRYAPISWSKFNNLGKTFHILEGGEAEG